MSDSIIFYITGTPYELVCEQCSNRYIMPIGIDGVSKIKDARFVCSVKCWRELKSIEKEIVS